MGAEPLDLENILAELKGKSDSWSGLAPETTIGHVHLHVAKLAEAEAFYVGALGFDLVQRYRPSALFVSAGGYHHHIGLNTWAGVGAPPPPPGAIGLRHFVVRLPDRAALDQAAARMRAAGLEPVEADRRLLIRDPARNALVLTAGLSS